MSYNIGSIDVVAAKNFRISAEALQQAMEECERLDQTPEGNIFEQLLRKHQVPMTGITITDEGAEFKKGAGLWWYGEFSGRSYIEGLIFIVLPAFTGSADLVVCWEDGDSYTGLRVKDGKVTEHEVVMSLGKRTSR